jgi:NADH:ubiquinone oxidoreductase subunit F (NADH-binding)
MEKVLLKNIENPNSRDIEEYLRNDGYKSLAKALEFQAKDIIDEVRKSGLRGTSSVMLTKESPAPLRTGRYWRKTPTC